MARPRSTEAHEKVLNAALELFAERGIETTSMDAIAQASGVSKATIYNHWKDKEALLLEAMLMIHGLDREPEDVDSGDVQRDLTTVLPASHRTNAMPCATGSRLPLLRIQLFIRNLGVSGDIV